ncbi:MAG: B12-binding domain-containing radical SAM protein [Bacteroidetes bacterium]|nr:B12-binding domain-containing radical SAM protein [Bacteroidota bacterium]
MNPSRKTLLLINPANPYRRGYLLRRESKQVPLGLGIIAAFTPKDWRIIIADENFKTFRYRDADLVGITAVTASVNRGYEIATQYRQRGVPVVMGGIHASMCPDETLQYVDSVVIGEAESIWPQVIADAEAGCLKQIYHGALLHLEKQKIPRHDLYHPLYVWRSIQTSRGCPMDCDFCSVTSFNGGKFRFRPVEEIIEELRAYHGDGRNIFFVDDNIGGITKDHQERAKELFRAIIRSGMKFNWFSQTSLDIADDDEVLRLASSSGCKVLLIGFEAERSEALHSGNKKINLKKGSENYRHIIRRIQKQGIIVLGTFIFAMEADHPEDIIRRARFISNLNVDIVQTSILTPYPGTKLRKRMEESGLLACHNYPFDWQYYNWEDIVIRHPHISSPELARLMEKSWKMIYHPLRRHIKYLKTLSATHDPMLAYWAWRGNWHYRNIVFEKPIHYCDKDREVTI